MSCTEPYALQSNTYESALVIEAIVTNEVKHQEVKLTRTYKLGERESENEVGAIVKIYGDDGSVYDFEEIDGIYKSIIEFQAISNVSYNLTIETTNGNHYTSSIQKLTTVNLLESVTATNSVNNGVRGVEIAVNCYDPTNTSKYYRYTYEETYKVIVPRWSPNTVTLNWKDSLIVSPSPD